MSTFTVTIEISPLRDEHWESVEVLVDTGATYTKVPRALLTRLGINPLTTRRAQVATGQIVQRELGAAKFRLHGEELPSVVTFGEEGEESLLGSVTLETFSLAVDPVNRRLIPVNSLELTGR